MKQITPLSPSTFTCIEKTYRGCAPLPAITCPNIRDDGNKVLVDTYPRLTSIEKALMEKAKCELRT